ncbi:MAG: hypothetical protein QM784_22995 [Polyangiaceae bacterium]
MSVTLAKEPWELETRGPMTEAAIRLLYEGSGKVRISKYAYDPGDVIEGQGKKCRGYVLSGSLTFSTEQGAALLRAGEIWMFSGGAYSIKVGEPEGALVLWVWELPPGFG